MQVFFKFLASCIWKWSLQKKAKRPVLRLCLYVYIGFFDSNSERIIWLSKWAECSPLTYRRRLSSILNHNMIIFYKFFRFLYLKIVLAEKNKMVCTKIICIFLYMFFWPQLRNDNLSLKMSRMIPLTYKRSLSSILIHNMIVLFKFFSFLYLKIVLAEKQWHVLRL